MIINNNDNSNDNDFRGRTSTQWLFVYLIPRRFSKTKYVYPKILRSTKTENLLNLKN